MVLAQGKPVSEQLELTAVIFQDSDSHRDLDGCKFVKSVLVQKLCQQGDLLPASEGGEGSIVAIPSLYLAHCSDGVLLNLSQV